MVRLKYVEKARRFKDRAYRENRGDPLKWKSRRDFDAYLGSFGGRLKEDRRRRMGYLVCVLQEKTRVLPFIVAEVPMDFAEKVLALGGFP
jgi:hypothetical protein